MNISIVADRDAYVYAFSPSTNYGSANTLVANTTWNGDITHEIFMRFNLSALPSDATIISTSLSVYANTAGNIILRSSWLYSDTDFAEETITWNNKPDLYEYQGSHNLTVGLNSVALFNSDGVTAADRSRGYITFLAEAYAGEEVELKSRETGTPSQRPTLTINYGKGLKIAATAGGIDRVAHKVMVAPVSGDEINQRVIGVKVYDGSAWKTVF